MKFQLEQRIPYRTVYRLSLYARALRRLDDRGAQTVSSQTLALASGVKAEQVRKDLTQVGHFGRPGLGYPVRQLYAHLQTVLGTTRLRPVVLMGAGRLGRALMAYPGFNKEGFELVAAFDSDPRQITNHPTDNGTVPVYPLNKLERIIKRHNARLAIVAVPAESAQSVVNRLIKAGVRGILNFSPVLLQVPEGITVNNVNLALELEQLHYFTEDSEPGKKAASKPQRP